MRIDITNIKHEVRRQLENFNFQQNRKLILIAVVILAVFIVGLSIFSLTRNVSNPDLPLTIQSFGMLDPLSEAMRDNADLRMRVERLMAYDTAYLFANYRRVNAEIAEVLFLWSGLRVEELKQLNSQRAVNLFLRRVHALPDDVIVENNPALGDRPWPTLFTRFKSRFLMMGQGHKIYKGRAYYDSIKDEMVVEGELSKDFVTTFHAFIKTQPSKTQKSLINNFLVFVDETKGLKNLNEKEKELIQSLRN